MRVPTISGTSVTAARIDAITTVDDGLYVLYLMRQEIFLAEGRRMADLGMRMPVAQHGDHRERQREGWRAVHGGP